MLSTCMPCHVAMKHTSQYFAHLNTHAQNLCLRGKNLYEEHCRHSLSILKNATLSPVGKSH